MTLVSDSRFRFTREKCLSAFCKMGVARAELVEPAPLNPDSIRANIYDDPIGFYRLGTVVGGRFKVSYFGRSDTSLRRRLLQHCQTSPETHFVYSVTRSILDAYNMECGEWHLPRRNVRNRIHPDSPRWIDYRCPYCGLERSAELKSFLEERVENERSKGAGRSSESGQ